MDNDIKKNAEGYSDPTAYRAIKNYTGMDADVRIGKPTLKESLREAAFHKLLDTIFTICELSGFHIEGRIAIRDKETGKVWR